MKNVLYIYLLLAVFAVSPIFGQTSSPNSDFEFGDFTGWSASNGVWGRANRPTEEVKYLNNIITPGRQTIISNLFYDRYTCGKLPSIPPDGGKYVARLGNAIKGAEIEQLRYTMTVDKSNALFIYKYAVVFEDPDHLPHEQPYFQLQVKDLDGNMLDSTCGYNRVVSGGNLGGFETCRVYKHPTNSDRDTLVHWKPWTSVALDLTRYIGQTVQLEFTNADCSKTGHWSYAYIEARTLEMGVLVKACKNDGEATLTAPDGFSSYLWSNGKSTKSITVKDPIEGEVYTCRMTSSPECYIILTAVIQVEEISITPDDVTICKGEPATLFAQGAVHYQWSNGLGSGPRKVLYPQTSTNYVVTGTTENGCIDIDTARVIVLEVEKLVATANSPCENGTLTLEAKPKNLAEYHWQGPLAFESSEQTNILDTVTLGMAGQYSLSAIDTNGCIMNAGVQVQVYDSPDVIARASTACAGGNILLRAFPENLSNYSWKGPNGFVSASKTASFENAKESLNGNYTVIGENSKGCKDSATVEIAVQPVPVANFSFDTVCAGSKVSFTDLSEGADSYEWDFGNGVYSQDKTPTGVTYNGMFDYSISLRVYSNKLCSHTVTKTYMPYSQPVALFRTNRACVGDTYELNDLSYVFGDSITSRNWDMGAMGSSTDKHPEILLSNTVPIPIKLTVSTAHCSAQMRDTIRPSEKPKVTVIDTSGCSPLEVAFKSLAQSRVFHTWSFGDGNVSYETSPNHVFFNESGSVKTFTVKELVSNEYGCSDSSFSTIDVMPGSTAKFTINPPNLCSGQTAGFVSTSTNASSIRWTFHDGTTTDETSPSRTYTNVSGKTDFFNIKLNTLSSFGCPDSVIHSVRVYPFPDKGIEQSVKAACSPALVKFETASQAAYFDWDFGDGSFEAGGNKIEHLYVNETKTSQSHIIKLKVSANNNCTADFLAEVIIHPSPEAKFAVDTNIGCSPFTAHISNQSAGATVYQWFVDSAPEDYGNEFDYLLENKTDKQASYRIELEAKNGFGCADKYALAMNVFPEVTAQFTAEPVIGCSPLDVIFTNTSLGANSYTWIYGDATFSSNLHSKHTYLNESDNVLSLMAQLVAKSAWGCTDSSDLRMITVNPLPVAKFETDTISGCSPLKVIIADKSKDAVSYSWDYGNGVTSTTLSPHQLYTNLDSFSKIFHINLEVVNKYGCSDKAVQPLTIFPQPSPAFIQPEPGCSPLDIRFVNNSTNSDVYIWNFGDGKMATTDDPLNTFINNSSDDETFSVGLEAITHLGCRATAWQNVTVYATPNPTFIPSRSAFTMPNATVDLDNRTKGDWDYRWSFGDGATAEGRNPEGHSYTAAGEYGIILYASGMHCADSVIHFIVINPAQIRAEFDSSYAGCSPVEARFYNRSINALEYEWDLGDGTIVTEENPQHTYTKPGTYMISLTVRNGELIDIARSHTVTVYQNAEALFDIAPKTVALPDAVVNTYNTSKNAEKYHWKYGASLVSDEFQPQLKYETEGQFDITLYVESRDGCKDSMVMKTAVNVLQTCEIKFPNAFTPNAQTGGFYDPLMPETNNDIFHPLSINVDSYKLQIFNRWGEIVFESFQVDKGWDGYYHDRLSKSDVYVWKCEATCIGGGTYKNLGNVTLMR